MSHTIIDSQLRKNYTNTTPTALYEANYRRLSRLIPNLKAIKLNKIIDLPISKLSIRILEQYKYTSLIVLQQSLITTFAPLSVINMELRVCHDACVIEVIAYQGESPIQSALTYPNKQMLQRDEKKQLNLLLKEILESALKNETATHHLSSIS